MSQWTMDYQPTYSFHLFKPVILDILSVCRKANRRVFCIVSCITLPISTSGVPRAPPLLISLPHPVVIIKMSLGLSNILESGMQKHFQLKHHCFSWCFSCRYTGIVPRVLLHMIKAQEGRTEGSHVIYSVYTFMHFCLHFLQ